jgi:hypothetical protein
MKRMNIVLCGRMQGFINVNFNGNYSNHCALKD